MLDLSGCRLFCLAPSVDIIIDPKFQIILFKFSFMDVLSITGISLVSLNADLASERCPGQCSHKLIFKLELLVALGDVPIRFSFNMMVLGHVP